MFACSSEKGPRGVFEGARFVLGNGVVLRDASYRRQSYSHFLHGSQQHVCSAQFVPRGFILRAG